MRVDATFIGVEVDDATARDSALAAKLTEVCPVDIYGTSSRPPGHLVLHEDNLDECVLCGLCLDATPPGAVRVLKLYDEGAELQRT